LLDNQRLLRPAVRFGTSSCLRSSPDDPARVTPLLRKVNEPSTPTAAVRLRQRGCARPELL